MRMTSVPDLSAVAESLRASVVQVRPGQAGGAGIVLRKRDGGLVIITNAHVVRGEVGAEVSIVADQEAVRTARVARIDEHRDIAYLTPYPLSLNGEGDLLPAVVGDLTAIRPGHLVIAVGHPFGLPNAVTAGVVHSVGPVRWEARLGPENRELSWIQADIHLAPGNSGGPLSDVQGRVIGINTMVAGGLALAVPIGEVEL
jgi:serine protease Do